MSEEIVRNEEQIVSELTGKGLLTPGHGPFVRDSASTSKMMLHVAVALLPALVIAAVVFGGRALTLTGITVMFAMITEALLGVALKRKDPVSDLSCMVTGMLLAYTLPVTCPYYVAAIGAVIAIGSKQAFGGFGKNVFNSALVGRLVITLVFNRHLTLWVVPFYNAEDVVTSATPMTDKLSSYYDLFMGNIPGTLGEISALALILGCFYLVVMRVISLHVPVAFVGTVALFSLIVGEDPIYQVMAGGLLLGAVFMASDPVTTPITGLGKIIFGFGCGAITAAIRFFTPLPEGVLAAILFMDLMTPAIDRLTERRPPKAKN